MKNLRPLGASRSVVLLAFCCMIPFGATLQAALINPKGDITSKQYDLKPYTKLTVEGDMDIYLIPGDGTSAEIKTYENIHELIEINQLTDELIIGIKDNNTFVRSPKVVVTLPVKDMRWVAAAGFVELDAEDVFSKEQVTIVSEGACEVEVTVNATIVHSYASDAANVELEGTADQFTLDHSGAVKSDCYDLKTRKIDAKVTGASLLKANVSDTIFAEVTGASKMLYRGEAEVVKQSVLGAAALEKVD